jgi:two-component sensor histidine kinase
MRELSHRVNNEFASAISVVSLAAARSASSDVKVALNDVSERLHHYADVHRVLQVPEHTTHIDVAAYFGQSCDSRNDPYPRHQPARIYRPRAISSAASA